MIASEIRQKARENLTGKWGKAALIALVFSLIMLAISFVSGILTAIPLIGIFVPIGIIVIEVPIFYGLIITFLKLKRNETVDYADFLNDGFKNFARSWKITGNILLKLLILLVLAFVFLIMCGFGATFGLTSLFLGSKFATVGFSSFGFVGIIGYIVCLVLLVVKGYLYSLSFFIAYDHPEISEKEAVEESEKLMQGHRWNLFWLFLTFIGWAILCCFTLGIGLLWLYPYMMIAFIFFYENLAGKSQVEIKGEVVKEEKKIEEPVSVSEEKIETEGKEEKTEETQEVVQEEVKEETEQQKPEVSPNEETIEQANQDSENTEKE